MTHKTRMLFVSLSFLFCWLLATPVIAGQFIVFELASSIRTLEDTSMPFVAARSKAQ